MKNDFDRLASVYDLLAQMVFGRQLDQAQQVFLTELALHDKVLIVGGGTGKVLEWLPPELAVQVDYLELSEKMMAKAKRRKSSASLTHFYHGDILEHEGSYDVIIANFFLDCFSEEVLHRVLRKLSGMMDKSSTLIVTDFKQARRRNNQLLQQVMHWFFRLSSNLDADHLLDLHKALLHAGFREVQYRELSKEQLFAGVFQRSNG